MKSLSAIVRTFLERCMTRIEYMQANITIFILVPFYYIFLMTVFREDLARVLGLDVWWQLVYVAFTTFLYLNSIGNLVQNINAYILLSEHEAKIRDRISTFQIRYLSRECFNYIVLKCIGMHNKRYYLLYLFYLTTFVGFISCCTYCYLIAKHGELNVCDEAVRIAASLKPCFLILLKDPARPPEYYVAFLIFNVTILVLAVGLLYYRCASLAKTVLSGSGFKESVVKVFGTKWYFAVFWPYIRSPEAECGSIVKMLKNVNLKVE